ncbi:competence/damage-inducible protein A [Aquibacillus koreensis]|uniref:Putative competence-damage inducible protein n=1 Tax=Aquibacillus koreensis TaxID=279446 RepID=A0A9X4AJA3_9BACI|nr:competence/damage-inducible protein A [Aquibacillus koreensis]MCT2534595.1 competence/damage-inducible protein A [Aquibacillus koreensis]MDC3421811.1 competence/damage-inducible protein A [Aquibacillus koreensis]
MRAYKAEIIAVGTELLLGQIANTNAQWLSKKLADYGIGVYFHGVVGDNLDRAKSLFTHAGERSDIIFVTGGLGPTDDDLTREAFQSISNKKMVEDNETIKKIERYFHKSNRQMTPNNRKQSLVFEDAQVLANSAGMAPGMIVEHNQKIWIFMPGVPREMKAIMTEHVLPYLQKELQLNEVIESRMLRFIGVGESQLEHELKDLIEKQQNPTIAPLASEGEVGLRLTAKASSKKEANDLINHIEKQVLDKVGAFFYGYDETSISKQVLNLLKNNNMTIAAAESLTGGKFSSDFVTNNGASEVFMGGVVCYSIKAKQDVLDVSSNVIEKFGTISRECAEEMAVKVSGKHASTFGISFTGVAGPDPSEGKEVGSVFISVYNRLTGESITKAYHFHGDRNAIRNRTVKKGFELLHNILNQ